MISPSNASPLYGTCMLVSGQIKHIEILDDHSLAIKFSYY